MGGKERGSRSWSHQKLRVRQVRETRGTSAATRPGHPRLMDAPKQLCMLHLSIGCLLFLRPVCELSARTAKAAEPPTNITHSHTLAGRTHTAASAPHLACIPRCGCCSPPCLCHMAVPVLLLWPLPQVLHAAGVGARAAERW